MGTVFRKRIAIAAAIAGTIACGAVVGALGLDMFAGMLAVAAWGIACIAFGFGEDLSENLGHDWREDEPDVVGDFLEDRFGVGI